MRVFNSDMGKLYELICNLEAIEELMQHYTDDKTKQRIAKNLKLIREPTDLKSIAANIQKYKKLLNEEAKKIHDDMKEDTGMPSIPVLRRAQPRR
jgi:3-polyprenyl-4-hydroxybenzoate decarboxylase